MKSKETVLKTLITFSLTILLILAFYILLKAWFEGHFELAGSIIVLLFEKEKIQLRPELLYKLSQVEEVQVNQGEWIGIAHQNNDSYKESRET